MTIEIKPYTHLEDEDNHFDLLIYSVQSATAEIATDVYNAISGNWKDDCFYHKLRVVPKFRNKRIKAYRTAVATEVWKRKK